MTMRRVLGVLATTLLGTVSAWGVDFAEGEMQAMPVQGGHAPKIDGDLSDWDLSAQEPIYISAQTAASMHAEWAAMYDDEALYISTRASMPNRPFVNTMNPQDAFWQGDLSQARLSADPGLKYPLDRNRDQGSDRIAHLSFWKNTETDEPFLHIGWGARFDKGSVVNPEGSAIAVDTSKPNEYTVEAKIPWSALNVPGGKNPFVPGSYTAFTAETLWIGGDKARTVLCYNKNPGTFAFNSPHTWGKLVFAETSPGKRIRPTMAEILAKVQAELQTEPAKVGVPFDVVVPADGLKVSVNILDAAGGVVREVIGGESHPKGTLTVYWDGRDAFGKPVPLGAYQWGAYFHKPLKAVYQGGVGSSGNPFYKTLDGKGGWGGDHSNPIDVAADEDSFYFLWPVAEAGRGLVRTDLSGTVIWRKDPFVGGGFGPFYAVAANSKYVFLSRGDDKIGGEGKTSAQLVRLLKPTGALTIWDPVVKNDEVAVSVADHVLVPAASTPYGLGAGRNKPGHPDGMVRQPDCCGLAATDTLVYFASYGAGRIFVVDAETGETRASMACPGVRGIALSPAGDLYAVSHVVGKSPSVLRFPKATGVGEAVVSEGLVAPYDVAVDPTGRICVSEAGSVQQVKVFGPDGRLLTALGKAGGRPWQGAYDPQGIAFLQPAGIAIDATGALLVTEASPPKVFSRLSLPDGKLLGRWYGPGVYWNSTWPMPEDPRNVFYMLTHAVGRADLAGVGKTGVPNAYWALDKAGYPHAGNLEERIPQPEVVRAANGELYFVKDSIKHVICLMQDDIMRPIAYWNPVYRDEKGKWLKNAYVDVWIDADGDGQMQDAESVQWDALADGSPINRLASTTSSMHMEPNGDLYFMSGDNCIVRVPATGFAANGTIAWDLGKAHRAVPEVAPGLKNIHITHREGILGVRLDSDGNIYTLFNTKLKGGSGDFDYADAATAQRMLEGMGHTSRFNVVKFAKFDAAGKPLWIAGRKATAGAAPGEMYHFWNMAGLVNDRYVAGASEWGQIYFYTHDGFYVDALMNNPGDVTDPGPYTFGGETSGGRVAYFPQTGEVWAYSSGMTYKVEGFRAGVVEGESRTKGTVVLDRIYELAATAAGPTAPLKIVRLSGDPMGDGKAWAGVPVSSLSRHSKPLATAQLGYDDRFLYARIEVQDPTPVQNGALADKLAFKGGDTAGIVLGPARSDAKPGLGDVRFMAAKLDGQAKLIAMKAVTKGPRQPEVYETPAAGRWPFDFVGEVPGGRVELTESVSGYVAVFAVPRSFLEFELKAGTGLRGDVEIRLSGAGQRGLQATSRNYLFTPDRSETTLVDDIPTEARIYPQYWGSVVVE
jgi:hypothetical protein